MMNFYFLVLVVGVMGLSDGEFMTCILRKPGPFTSCSEDNDPRIPLEDYRKNIHLFMGTGVRTFCPIIPNLNIVQNFRHFYILTCMGKTDEWHQGCDLYYLYYEKSLYLSALLSALPDKLGSQDWKEKVTDILEGVPGVQEWLNKSEEFYEGLHRPRDWVKEDGGFLKNVSESQDWLTNIKKYFPDNTTDTICEEENYNEKKNNDDDNDEARNSASHLAILKMVLPGLAVVHILVICSFFL